MTVRETFKNNLKFYRKESGLTQEQLAEKINCNSKYISEIESRQKFPSAETIDAIAKALCISPSQLFEEQGCPRNSISFDKEKFANELSNELYTRLNKSMIDYFNEKI